MQKVVKTFLGLKKIKNRALRYVTAIITIAISMYVLRFTFTPQEMILTYLTTKITINQHVRTRYSPANDIFQNQILLSTKYICR